MQSSMGPTNEFVEVDGAALIENFGSTMVRRDARECSVAARRT